LPGDADGNGEVNAADAARLAENWGATILNPSYDTWWEMGDFDGDFRVGPADASILAANWGASGESSGSSPVPEPSTVVLLMFAAAAALGSRGRRRQHPGTDPEHLTV
jgi:hypothetical protein